MTDESRRDPPIDKWMDYAIDLQRIIEDICRGDRTIREPSTTARYHYDMAVKYVANDYVMVQKAAAVDAAAREIARSVAQECYDLGDENLEWEIDRTFGSFRDLATIILNAALAAAPPSPRSDDGSGLTPSDDASSAALRAQVIEECAKVIVDNMLCDDDDGSEVLLPRTNPGNKVGFAYAEAIRSLSAVSAIAQERDVGKIEWRDLKREIGNMKNELNGMALVGAKPLWNSLVGRLDDLCERLSPTTLPKAIGEEPSSSEAVNTTPQSIEVGEMVENFREINPSNYDHDDVCALNNWGCEAHSLLIALDAERGRLREALAAVVKVHDHEDPFDAAHVSEFNRAMEIARLEGRSLNR